MESAHSLSDAKIATPIVQLASNAGDPFGPIATATPVQPPNVDNVANVAMLPIQKPGAWHLVATAEQGGYPRRERDRRDRVAHRRRRLIADPLIAHSGALRPV